MTEICQYDKNKSNDISSYVNMIQILMSKWYKYVKIIQLEMSINYVTYIDAYYVRNILQTSLI